MPTTKAAYWQEMKDKAAERIAHVAEDHVPHDESEVKELLADVLKHGTCKDAAEAIVEAVEFMCSCHMLAAHSMNA